MNIKGIRIPVVIIIIVLVLAVLFGIQYIYHKINVEQPLFKLYSQTKAVQKFDIDNKSGSTIVNIDLKHTDNLGKTYQQIYQTTANVLGKNGFKLNIKDSRSPELESAYYDMQFIINEALVRGNFSQMENVIEEKAAQAGVTSRVFIDNQNIYIQLDKNKKYLYEVVPRPQVNNENLSGNKPVGGGQSG